MVFSLKVHFVNPMEICSIIYCPPASMREAIVVDRLGHSPQFPPFQAFRQNSLQTAAWCAERRRRRPKMALQKLALGQTLSISAADGHGLHINFGPERGYAELWVEE